MHSAFHTWHGPTGFEFALPCVLKSHIIKVHSHGHSGMLTSALFHPAGYYGGIAVLSRVLLIYLRRGRLVVKVIFWAVGETNRN